MHEFEFFSRSSQNEETRLIAFLLVYISPKRDKQFDIQLMYHDMGYVKWKSVNRLAYWVVKVLNNINTTLSLIRLPNLVFPTNFFLQFSCKKFLEIQAECKHHRNDQKFNEPKNKILKRKKICLSYQINAPGCAPSLGTCPCRIFPSDVFWRKHGVPRTMAPAPQTVSWRLVRTSASRTTTASILQCR